MRSLEDGIDRLSRKVRNYLPSTLCNILEGQRSRALFWFENMKIKDTLEDLWVDGRYKNLKKRKEGYGLVSSVFGAR
jgi:uncharacterized protein YcaQ